MYPLPDNEWQRVIDLADYDLDFSALQDTFKDLTKLAAKVTGTDISLINLIDSYTQWSIASHGLDLVSMPREDSVCQYTILQPDSLEVKDLQLDQRFAQQWYVADDPHLRYYFGIPLKSSQGTHLGALCVLDPKSKELDPEKIELLHIIAAEVVSRLNIIREVAYLKRQATELEESKKRVAHDIRGPLGGIISMAQLVTSSGSTIKLHEILELIEVMQHSSKSLLDLADEILVNDDKWHHRKQDSVSHEVFHQARFKEMLEKLYAPQARAKGIDLSVSTDATTELLPFSRNKVLQIAGNLISNALKFTPQQGWVRVSTKLTDEGTYNLLSLVVEDSGQGMASDKVAAILKGEGTSSHGTAGESGYGFGLPLVKHLVETLNGQLRVGSTPGHGSCFEVSLRQPK
ncbi:HAMP domain-containing sensor histidine kinase [Spirosoma sp. KNUC1025]|uniref:sensor histidine kinase n=1 Tax=Spirosoma sp. KNUC1025 TaxID=2894082 RepID=UPI001E5987C2|nr:GAF domain-containing sensor histidine kinase [Spirosoma sp. KNUC1025]UFH57645.1 GAF domain-containing sensor histidine kinase [Spirosoma sp. KNUC1025]UFH57751.1 GAF domain-containing sensor histidine kinase [Spirosoma sp. KNUC1025]